MVRGGVAENLTLTDGYDFFTPVKFTAANVSYTRTFTLAANGSSGWNTLFLPFTATTVTCDGIGEVDWFHSANDTGRNFWLRNFISDGEGSVAFNYASEVAIAANTPYIIAVPDNRFGDEWQMTGKTVTFSGSNVDIAASVSPDGSGTLVTPGISGNHYKFCGTTKAVSVGGTAPDASSAYLLNASGSKFVKANTSTDVAPFRAWFVPVSISSLTLPSLSIGSSEFTGIVSLADDNLSKRADVWYTLDGRRLPSAPVAPGIYINKGNKIVIK